MYDFSEVQNLSELKELCFYLEIFNKFPGDENFVKTIKFIKKEYNLEVPASKLYVFKAKILKLIGKNKLIQINTEDILNQYKQLKYSETDKIELEINERLIKQNEKRYRISKNNFLSEKDIKQIVANETNYKKSQFLLWFLSIIVTFALSFLIVCLVYFLTNTKIIFNIDTLTVCLSMSILVLWPIYLGLYYLNLVNVLNLNKIKHTYNTNKNKFEENDKEIISLKQKYLDIHNECCFDELNIFKENNLNKIKTSGIDDLNSIGFRFNTTLNLSKSEQNRKWQISALGRESKSKIDAELMNRMDFATKVLSKDPSYQDRLNLLLEFYCGFMSAKIRKTKIDNAISKYELNETYIDFVKKIDDICGENMNIKFQESCNNSCISDEEQEDMQMQLNTTCYRVQISQLKNGLNTNKDNFAICSKILTGEYLGIKIYEIKNRFESAVIYNKICDMLAFFEK